LPKRQRLCQLPPMVGRTAEAGDELGSRQLSAGLAGDLLSLAFALSGRWAPYAKWRGTVFRSLPIAAKLGPLLDGAAAAPGWRERENALAAACEVLLGSQRERGQPAPESAVIPFFDRPGCHLAAWSTVTAQSGTAAPPKNTYGRIKSMSEPTGKYSITMPRDIAEAARARSGQSGLSGYVAAAVARQIERDNLNELIAVAEAEHGPVTEEEVRARREELRQARAEQGHPRSGVA
jgi:hypothetical protein